jgi:hypothetical protein
MFSIVSLIVTLFLSPLAEAKPAVCAKVFASKGAAERACRPAGYSLLTYTNLGFYFSEKREQVLGYGCDCGRFYRRPPGITAPSLCIRQEDSLWSSCAIMKCEYGDASPWCEGDPT